VEGRKLQKTNAARASHPSRIVIVDVLVAIVRFRERSSRNGKSKNAVLRCSLLLALQGYDFALPSLLEERFLRPLSPGTGTLDMHPISPDDSLSKNHRQRKIFIGTSSEHLTLLTA
jgi:hypothetical protein